MMHHVSINWSETADVTLWPLAMLHAVHIVNCKTLLLLAIHTKYPGLCNIILYTKSFVVCLNNLKSVNRYTNNN